LTANLDLESDSDGSGGGQVGLDIGVFGENDDGDRGEAGATINLDQQRAADGTVEQTGIDVGVFGEDGEGDRGEGGVTLNDDNDGFDVGGYLEDAEGNRAEAGATADLSTVSDDGLTTNTATVGVFAEDDSGRSETSVGGQVEYGQGQAGAAIGVDSDGDGQLDSAYGVQTGAEFGSGSAGVTVDLVAGDQSYGARVTVDPEETARDFGKGTQAAGEGTNDVLDDVGDAADEAADDLGDWIDDAADDAGDGLSDPLNDALDDAGDSANGALDDLGDAVEEGADAAGDAVEDAADVFGGLFGA